MSERRDRDLQHVREALRRQDELHGDEDAAERDAEPPGEHPAEAEDEGEDADRD